MRKLVLGMLTGAMIMASFAGCSKKTDNKDTVGNNPTVSVEENASLESSKVTIKDTKGEFTLEAPAKKIVVFDMGALDTIHAFEADVELAVVQSNLPSYLGEYKAGTVNAGSLFEPDMEAIFDFEPDVIIIGGRQADYYDELKEIAPTLYVTTNGATFVEDVAFNTENIAKLLGKEAEVASKLEAVNGRIKEVYEIASNSEAGGLVLLTNDGNISAYGIGSRFGMLHETLGVKAADENIEVSTHGQEASFEYIAKVNPDMIFVVDRTAIAGGSTTAEVTLSNELVDTTNAAKNNKIITLDAECWYLSSGGLNALEVMIEDVANAYK